MRLEPFAFQGLESALMDALQRRFGSDLDEVLSQAGDAAAHARTSPFLGKVSRSVGSVGALYDEPVYTLPQEA